MDELRKKAEAILKNSTLENVELSKLELDKVFEEINIHQIELQIQNDELREKNSEIEEAKSKYFSLFNFAPVGYIIIDEKAIIRECNIKASEIFQRRKEYLINHPFISFVKGSNISDFYEGLELAKKDQIKDKFEIVLLVIKEDRYFEISINKYGLDLFLVILTDITERKEAEQALKESSEHFKILYNNVTDAVFYTNFTTGLFITVNETAQKKYGYSDVEFSGMSILKIDAKYDQTGVAELFQKLQEKDIVIFDTLHKTKTGEIFPVEVKAKLINDKTLISVARDISERKRQELVIQKQNEELIKLNNDKDRFIQILAHDLRNPFNSLLGFSNLLVQNVRKYDLDKIEKQVKIINEATKRTFNLLEDILLWTMAHSGKLPFSPQKLIFSDICKQVIANLELTAKNKNITINHFSEDKLIVFADKSILYSILINLISNAIKFTDNQGQIDVFAIQNEIETTVTVSDNGTGITPEILNKLFDISQKITTEGTAKEKGTGLGLLLCKEFVEKHGGKIWVESEFGHGSDFKFTIPLC